jgi:hypothetical protein
LMTFCILFGGTLDLFALCIVQGCQWVEFIVDHDDELRDSSRTNHDCRRGGYCIF